MITLVAKLTAAEGKADELQAALTEMVNEVRSAEAGKATSYALHRLNEDPNVFMFYEQYADEAALEAHRTTAHMTAMNGKLKEGKLLGGRPSIERYTQIPPM